MAKHWRHGHRRNGTWIPAGWVNGTNPKTGCSFWMLGMIGLTALATTAMRRTGRR